MNGVTSRRRRLLSAFAKVDLESFKETFDVSDELMSALVCMIEENKRKKKEADLSYYSKHREEILVRLSKEKEKRNASRLAWQHKKMQDPEYRDKVNEKARAYMHKRLENDPEFRAHRAELSRKYKEAKKRAQSEQGENT